MVRIPIVQLLRRHGDCDGHAAHRDRGHRLGSGPTERVVQTGRFPGLDTKCLSAPQAENWLEHRELTDRESDAENTRLEIRRM